MTLTVTVDRDKCASCTSCVMLAPDVFDLDDDALVVVLEPHPPEEQKESVREAALSCPADVITVTSQDL